MTSPPAFDLIDEPWIRVRTVESTLVEMSLRSVLFEASRIRRLAGELPTQDAAILRLLLAIVLGAQRPQEHRTEEEAIELWREWWDRKELPIAGITLYLGQLRERFDLLHPKTPFFQVSGLTTTTGKRSGLGKLIADLPDGEAFFTTRAGSAAESLSLAEAARWVVHCQAFDPSGIKTGAAGDDRVKGGKGYPFGYPAWAGNLGLVLAEGATLFETLLFNIPLVQSGPDDLPVWDRAPLGPGADATHTLPTGPADLFTWPSRRLRLFLEAERVVDVQISNGDKLGPQNMHPFEPMSAWRWSKNQSKAGADVLMPVTHDPTRRIWQGLEPLLVKRAGPRGGVRAGVIEWLATLRYDGVLAAKQPVDLWTVGLEYGTQNSTITGTVDDRLAAPVTALTDPTVVAAAVDAATWAREGAVALVNLASNLDRAAGGDGSAGREEAFERAYALLDSPYRAWLRELTDPDSVHKAKDAWGREASAMLRRAADELIRDAGPAALIGRLVTEHGGEQQRLLDAGLASVWFLAALKKAFPYSHPTEKVTA